MNLTHPNTDHAIEVDPDHAGPYLSQGWQESTPPKKKTSTDRASDGEGGTAPLDNTTKEEA